MKNLFLASAFLLTPFFLGAQTYNGTGGVINDVAVNTFTANVSGLSPATIDTTLFGLESICVNLTHTYDGDLLLEIIAPDGTTATLSREQGGGGDNYTNTCFNETAVTSITLGIPPFTGSFVPQGFLGRLNNNQNGNGTWSLRITDL
jgi:hypothetical protein